MPWKNSRVAAQERAPNTILRVSTAGGPLAVDFWWVGIRCSDKLGRFSSFLVNVGHVVWPLGLERRRLPQTRPLKLVRILSYGTLANNICQKTTTRIRELAEGKAEDKAENKIHTVAYMKQ